MGSKWPAVLVEAPGRVGRRQRARRVDLLAVPFRVVGTTDGLARRQAGSVSDAPQRSGVEDRGRIPRAPLGDEQIDVEQHALVVLKVVKEVLNDDVHHETLDRGQRALERMSASR